MTMPEQQRELKSPAGPRFEPAGLHLSPNRIYPPYPAPLCKTAAAAMSRPAHILNVTRCRAV
jgi:hypothetical protein